MLALEAFPTFSMLKYNRSSDRPAFCASPSTIVLLAWCGTIRSMLSSSEPSVPAGPGSAEISSIICTR